jgi:hypothetical protein
MSDRLRVVTVSSYRQVWDHTSVPSAPFLLEMAQELFSLGHTRAAGCIARQAIEVALGEWLRARTVRHPNSGQCVDPEIDTGSFMGNRIRANTATLAAAGAINPNLRAKIDGAVDVGNRSCHGQSVQPSTVAMLIEVAIDIEARAARASQSAKDYLARPIIAEPEPVPAMAVNYVEPYSVAFA